MSTEILNSLLGILAASGLVGSAGVAVGYFLFKMLATKWLDNNFAKRLEAYKHQQQRELEQLRFQINALFDRVTKLHQREFQVLPDAWALLFDAVLEMKAFVSSLQTYPDLDNMKPTQFTEFVEACPFATWEKEELKSIPPGDRTKYYRDHIFWHQSKTASTASNDCHTFLRKNGIFIERTLKQRFQRIDQLVREAIVHRKSIQQYALPGLWEQIEALSEEGDALLDELEHLVQGRLWTRDIEN
jgi:hypothetical protein